MNTMMSSLTSVSAVTLKNTPDRFKFIAVPVSGIEVIGESKTYFVNKTSPDAAAVVPVLHMALDRGQNLFVRTAPDDALRIVEARLNEAHEWRLFDCPDRADMTPAFWNRQQRVQLAPVDQVRWVSTPPGCSSSIVSFYRCAAPRWIHAGHPRANQMVETARRSIDEDVWVQQVFCSEAEQFLTDLVVITH